MNNTDCENKRMKVIIKILYEPNKIFRFLGQGNPNLKILGWVRFCSCKIHNVQFIYISI